MDATIFGYAIDGSVVDYSTYVVSILMIPISLAWKNVRVLFGNWKAVAGGEKEAYPLLGGWDHATRVFVSGVSLVPCAYLILSCFSHAALKDLLEAGKFTLASGGTLAIFVTLRDIFKRS